MPITLGGNTYTSVIVAGVATWVSKITPVGPAISLTQSQGIIHFAHKLTYHIDVENGHTGCVVVLVEHTLKFFIQ